MLKKLLLAGTIIFGFAISSNAQSFTIPAGNPVDSFTQGSSATIEVDLRVKNITASETFKLNWSVISTEFPGSGWSLVSVCDNQQCYNNTDATPLLNQNKTTFDITPGSTALFRTGFLVLPTAINGTGIVKVRAGIALGQTDTLIFRVTKTPTGVSIVNIADSRVSIYPNPGSNTISVFADKTLNASRISIISITGQVINNTVLVSGKEINDININSLSKGTYIVRLTDNKGKLITSRKFIKE